MKPVRTVGIGLLGFGTVAGGVVRILRTNAKAIEERTGVRLALKKICVKSLSKKRRERVPKKILTSDPDVLISDPSIDILVELIGGIHPAKEIIHKALARGKHVVTANKALLAEDGQSLFRQAEAHSGKLGFEASVCGGIPIIRSLEEGLASNNISRFLGIVNGTCNFILTAMSERNLTFKEALKIAQGKGYAERDPRLDIDGVDSAHKLAILARLAFRSEVSFRSIAVEGIRSLAAADIAYAKELGYAVKLLAIAKRGKGGLELRVHPTLLPLEHPLSSVRGVYNAVFIEADQAGDLLFYGQGAGRMPTASAVMSDILAIAKNLSDQPEPVGRLSRSSRKIAVLPMERIVSKYYLRFQVADRPGVLGRIARTLGKHDISILSVHQKETHDPDSTPVIILTYGAAEKNVRQALKEIDSEPYVSEKTVLIRVEK